MREICARIMRDARPRRTIIRDIHADVSRGDSSRVGGVSFAPGFWAWFGCLMEGLDGSGGDPGWTNLCMILALWIN